MNKVATDISKLPSKKIRSILGNPEKSALAVNLVYVHQTDQGIKRVKQENKYYYLNEHNQKLDDPSTLLRIKHLVIPPAWEDVWICALENGHLQATGVDSKNRKQYKYHELWNALRNHTKYYRLLQFAKVIPAIRLQVEKDISLPGLPEQKVLALAISLMERTNIRVGNNEYEKLYGSFGLTTLKDKHVAINGNELKFSFKGKKGIHHEISIKNKKLAQIVKACKDISGKELFQYYTPDGDKKSIDSGMINTYIKQISGGDFTTKDFRTWSGTVHAFLAFKSLGTFETETEGKKKIASAVSLVAKQLGNTATVCKKYYIHPTIISLYENKALEKYYHELDHISVNDYKAGLTSAEKMVMKILEHN